MEAEPHRLPGLESIDVRGEPHLGVSRRDRRALQRMGGRGAKAKGEGKTKGQAKRREPDHGASKVVAASHWPERASIGARCWNLEPDSNFASGAGAQGLHCGCDREP